MLADLNATHLTEQEQVYLSELQKPVNVFAQFLKIRYGVNVVGFNPDNGQIIRQVATPPDGQDKSPPATVPGDSNS